MAKTGKGHRPITGVGAGTGKQFPSAGPDNPSRIPPSGKKDNRAVDRKAPTVDERGHIVDGE